MKKFSVVLVILLCAFSAFAAKQVVSFKCNPWASQISTSSDEPVYKVQSDWGIGAEASYKRYLTDYAFVTGGISYTGLSLPEGRPLFTSLMPFAGAGAECHVCDFFKVSVNAGLGLDSLIYDKLLSESITIKTGASVDFYLTDKAEFALGCDATFGFAEKTKTKYTNYRILPTVGFNVEL